MKTLIVASLVALTILQSGSAPAAALADYLGTWKVAKVVGFGDVSSGAKEAAKALGQPVIISRTSIQMPSGDCTDHTVLFTVADVDKVLSESWQIARSDLNLTPYRLGQHAGYIDATCADGLVLDKNALLMPSGDGAFYIVKRSKPQH